MTEELDEMGLLGQSDQFYPVVNDYVEPRWATNSFIFDATNNIFTGDGTASSLINNMFVPSNSLFTISFWIKRGAAGVTQPIMGRDKSSVTAVRQFLIQYTSTNLFQITLFTDTNNRIQYNSTATFTETREWNHWTIVYDGTQSATSRLTIYRNAIVEAGTTSQTGTFTTINNTSTPNIEIGARSDVATWGNCRLCEIAIFNYNLSQAQVSTIFNNRVPIDLRNISGLNGPTLYLNVDNNATFSSNWSWTDLSGGAVFTSSGMVAADQINDVPAKRQITVIAIHGQSNASGRVKMWQLPDYFRGSLNWCKVWDGTNFVNINSVTNNNQYFDTVSAVEFGVEYPLAEYLNRKYGKTIYYFKVVRGASYLANTAPSWSRNPQGALMTQLITDINNMKEWELANGYTITKYRLIWIQGEADSQTSANANNYNANWTSWIQGVANSSVFNRILDNFYIQGKYYDCLLSANQTSSDLAFKSTINTAKTTVAATDTKNFRTINTDGALVQNTDYIHYNLDGINYIANQIGVLMDSDTI